MTPIVTTFITVYNEEEWIESAVRSLLEQTLSDIEVLVLDDGSTDRTVEILRGFDDDRLRILTPGRLGRALALARVAEEARGEFLANLDADDDALPDRLNEQVIFLKSNSDVGWVGSAELREDSQRGESYVRQYPLSDREIRLQSAKCIPYCHSAVMFRKALVTAGLNYDPKQPFLIDFEYFLRVARRCQVANLPEPLVKRRARDASFFQKSFTYSQQNLKLVALCRRAIREFRLPLTSNLYPMMRLAYPYLPNSLKRTSRRWNGLQESYRKEPC